MTEINITKTEAHKAFLNVMLHNNSMGISDKQMGEIGQLYPNEVKKWTEQLKNSSKDENDYEIDEKELEKFTSTTYKSTKNKVGYTKGNQVKDITLDVLPDAGIGLASGVMLAGGKKIFEGAANAAGKKVTEKVTKKLIKKAKDEAGEKAAEEAGKKAGENITKNLSAYVQVALTIAAAAKYYIDKPNKEAKEACDELQNEMANSQCALDDQQSEMEDMGENLIALSDEANEANEEAATEIKEEKTEYDMYMASVTTIGNKIATGQKLTESERTLYNQLVPLVQASGVKIGEMSEDATELVGDIYTDMETYQEGYDYAAETMAEIEGITDYAESFDEASQVMCYVEGGAQTLNAASGARASARLFAGPWWNWAIAAAGMVASAGCGVAAGEQFKFAKGIGDEIKERNITQDMNAATMDFYDEEIDGYEALLTDTKELGHAIPDEIGGEDEIETMAEQTQSLKTISNAQTTTTETTTPMQTENDKKKKSKENIT